MELLVLTGTWWIVGFSGAMMPGPVTTLIVTESARRGFWAGPLVTLGHVFIELVIVAGLVVGLGDVLKHPFVAGAIGLLGGLFLLWMGYETMRAAWRGQVTLELRNADSNSSAGNPIIAGVLTSVSNPYMLLWWSTVGALWLITFTAFGPAGLVAFYLGHTFADWVWNAFVALIVTTGRRFIGDRLYRGILIACGLFLVALAVYFGVSGFRFLASLHS